MNRIALLLTFMSTSALASDNYTQDARQLSAAALCGATNVTCQQAYLTGAKDGTAAFKRVKATYVAIRAAEVVPPPPPPSPPPSPPPVEVIPTPGLDPVADGLDVNAFLQPSWGTGAIPASAKPDVVGAFRLICQAGMSNARLAEMIKYDDPIVYPGQPGKSHLHQFFGNTGADANSTYASLRTSGESSCGNIMNRSAYWQPAMMDGKGFVVPPDYVTIYYKRRAKTDPFCNANGQKGCVDLPRGLRFIYGKNMLDMAAKSTGAGYFNCQGTGAVPGHYPSIVEAAKNCPIGAQLGAIISAPSCWDGKNLDSADHRSHVAYPPYPGDVNSACPATHPYVIPTFTLGAWYTTDETLDRSGTWDGTLNSWHLSSDRPDAMAGMTMPVSKPGTTLHADWFGAWNDTVLARWHAGCVNGLLNCSGADLGDGKQLKQAYPDNWAKRPRVPVPARP